jgi:hypothetical protein
MAYAGIPTGMAKPATTNPWFKPVLTAVALLALACALALAASFVVSRQAAPVADHSYDQIEAQRGATSLSAVTAHLEAIEKAAEAKARAMSGVPADTSYEAVENLRANFGVTVDTAAIEKAAAAKARAMSGVPVDTSYDAIEKIRAGSGVTVDTSYEAIEKLRAAGPGAGSSLDAGSFDRKYQEIEARGQHGQLR